MPPTITLTPEQSTAASILVKWAKQTLDAIARGNPPTKMWFAFGGLGGTGKTTVLSHVVPELQRHCRFVMCAPTGKAVSVLRSKGLPAQTIHSPFYTASKDARGKLVFHKKEPHELAQEVDLIGIDEASMVNQTVHQDLLSYGIPIIYVGDYGQLPPVGIDPQIMSLLDAKLETIHRQALESPIIRLAHHVRTTGAWETWPEWNTVDPALIRRLPLRDPAVFSHVSQFITSLNTDRVAINKHFRSAYQRTKILEPGERIICLKNNRKVGLFNGMILTVREAAQDLSTIVATLEDDEGNFYPDINITTSCFHVEKPLLDNIPWSLTAFDYASAITCHKAQGSQFPSVTLMETPMPRLWTRHRWLYTAVTRASEGVTIITSR